MRKWCLFTCLLLLGWTATTLPLTAAPARDGGDDPAQWSRKRFQQEAVHMRRALDSYATSEADYDQMDTLQAAISQGLLQLLQCPHSLGTAMDTVLHAPGIIVGESSDRMVRTLALQERNGGSDQHYISVLQYCKDSRHPWATFLGEAPAGVVPVNALAQTYLALETRQTCSSCYAARATLLSFGAAGCLETLVWSWQGQGEWPTYGFDPETKTFTYTYVQLVEIPVDAGNPDGATTRVRMRYTGAYIWTGTGFDLLEEYEESLGSGE